MIKLFLLSFITYKLSNGLTIIYDKREKKNVFTFLVLVNSGSYNEGKGYEGLTHFLEHMLFDGNERFSREELRKNFDRFGLYVNAFTREDYTAYFFSGPDKNWKEGIYLLYLMLFKSTFPDKEFEKEKKVVLEEMFQDRSREFNIVKEKIDSVLYKGTNYSHPVIGHENTIKNLDKEKLIEFYKKFYVPNNMLIFARGDIDENEFLKFIEEYFGKEKKKEVYISEEKINLEDFLGEKIFVEMENIENSYISLNIKAVPLNHPSAHYYIILSEIMNSNIGIKRLLQENKNILNADISYEIRRRFGILSLNITLKGEQSKDTLNLIAEKLEKFINDFFKNLKKEDFERTKNKIIKQKVFDELDPVYSIFYLTDYLVYKDPYLRENILKSIKNSSFLDFVGFFMNKFKNKRTIYVVLKDKERENKEVFPEAIHILIKGRLFYEPLGKNGLSQVFFRALLSKKIEETIEKEGLRVKTYDNPYIPFDDYYHRRDFGYIRIIFPSEEKAKIPEFLKKIMSPDFDSLDFEKAKKEATFAKMLSQKDPMIRAWEEFNKKIFKGVYSRSLHGEIEEIRNIKKEDLLKYGENVFLKENLIITYESETPDSLLKRKLKEFADNTSGKEIEFNYRVFNDTLKLNTKQSYIIGGRIFDINDKEEILKYTALSLILSDRMQEIVREKMGASYRLYSGVKIFPSKILFYFEIGTDKEKIEEVTNTLNEIFENMKKKIEEEEFEIAVNSFSGNMLRRLENPETRSFYKGFYIYTGLGYDFDSYMIENIKKLKAKKLQKLAKEVLNFDEFSKIYLIGEM